ncbi:hypothetical protein PAHAL_2G331300 [Panicum hallii]|uniref:Uncharacterized protein n=1 Tax=Panicum hallii TaxID=206008 RepID=A0A2T8KR85_9POAL|nr:hypothetical protein PAHAL_2G331300 [Panicum hallii]
MPEAAAAARAGYVPLGAAERQRRALFLQSYRFSVDDDDDRPQGTALRGRLLRMLREAGGAVAQAAGRARGAARWWAGAGLARAWRGWRPRAADHPLLGCFGAGHHHRKYYLHGYA